MNAFYPRVERGPSKSTRVNASIPQCEPVAYTVHDAAVDGPSFELVPTGNPKAFHARAQREGESVFRARVEVEGEPLEVTSTLRAWVPDRVWFTPHCQPTAAGESMLSGHVPVDATVNFTHQLFRGDLRLGGYGYYGVSHPRLVMRQLDRGPLSVQVTGGRGAFTVRSEVDPSLALDLTVYDASDFDELSLRRATDERFFVGETTSILPRITIGGKVPCVWGYPRQMTIETPAVCGFESSPGVATVPHGANSPVAIKALAPGTCRVRVTQPSTSLAASLEIPVYRTFEQIPFPSGKPGPAINLTDVWAKGPDEVLLVGWEDDTAGALEAVGWRWSGGTWGRLEQWRNPGDALRAVHGSHADGAVFAVGNDGRGARWDGARWIPFDTGVRESLNDVWVNAANDVYAAGDNGTFLHFDGVRWTPIPTGGTAQPLRSLWGNGAGHMYVAGWGRPPVSRWDGAAFSAVLPVGLKDGPFGPNAIRGSGPADLWINSVQEALHFDGARWTEHTFGTQLGEDALEEVWPMGDGTAYVLARKGSRTSVKRVTGTGWVSMPLDGTPIAITGFGRDIFVVTNRGMYRYRHNPADVFP